MIIYLATSLSVFWGAMTNAGDITPIAQSIPNTVTYYSTEQGVFVGQGEKQNQLIDLDPHLYHVRQSGSRLLAATLPTTSEIKIFERGKFQRDIALATFNSPFIMDYQPNKLFIGGFNQERNMLIFQCLSDLGKVISEKRVPFEDKTLYTRDNYRLASVLIQDQWIVWVPSQLQALVFDLSLNLIKTQDLEVPEHLLDLGDIERVLFREPDAVSRQKQCEELVGSTIAALPMNLISGEGKLGLVFQCATLTGCGDLTRVQAKNPVSTTIRTEVVWVDGDFELQDINVIDGHYVQGYYGSENKLCGRKYVNGAYREQVWSANW